MHENDREYFLIVCVRGHVPEPDRDEPRKTKVERGAVPALENQAKTVLNVAEKHQMSHKRSGSVL